MHGIKIEFGTLTEVMLFIKYLRYEAKSDTAIEKKVLDVLVTKLAKEKISIQTKLVICVVADTFDNFKGQLEKVLFGETSSEKLFCALCDVDLSTDENKQLIALVAGDKKTPDQIECEIHMLALKMKKSKVMKPLVSGIIATQTTVQVQIYMRSNNNFHHYIRKGDLEVELVHTLNQLRDQVRTKWRLGDADIKIINEDRKVIETNLNQTTKQEALYTLL